MILNKLIEQKLIKDYPKWLPDNIMYLTVMGSRAYGTNSPDADYDCYGFCIPPKNVVFPHLSGEIEGFGRQKKRFEQFESKKIFTETKQEWGFDIYNITKFFMLLSENNPNVIDAIFTPADCILKQTTVGTMVKEKRKLFLHKGSYHKFKGYLYSQMNKAENAKKAGRAELVEKYGWDTKFLSHCFRLATELEQILETGDLDLRKNADEIKAIKNGLISLQDVKQKIGNMEEKLDKLYLESPLPYSPDMDKIKQLLLDCLEHHYGSISDCVVVEGREKQIIRQLKEILDKYKEV